jgi:hypothetical protein
VAGYGDNGVAWVAAATAAAAIAAAVDAVDVVGAIEVGIAVTVAIAAFLPRVGAAARLLRDTGVALSN